MKRKHSVFLAVMLTIVAVVAGITMISVNGVEASIHYKRSKTVPIKKKTYVTLKSSVYTYKDNKNYKKWTFSKNHNLGDYPNTTWTATKKTYIQMRGEKRLYYWVSNSKKRVSGWVYGKQLIASYKRTKDTKIKAKEYYTVSKTGSTYKKNSKISQWTFKANNALKDTSNITWTATKKTSITVNGSKKIYYWVTPHDCRFNSGWINYSYLKPGKNYQMTDVKTIPSKNMIMAKPGRAYMLYETKYLSSFGNGIKLSDRENYQTMKEATIYIKGKPYTYYLVNGVKKAGYTGAWVRSDYLKEGQSLKAVEDAMADSTKAYDYSVDTYLAVLINQYRASKNLPALYVPAFSGNAYDEETYNLANDNREKPNANGVVKFKNLDTPLATAKAIFKLDQEKLNDKLLSTSGNNLYMAEEYYMAYNAREFEGTAAFSIK